MTVRTDCYGPATASLPSWTASQEKQVSKRTHETAPCPRIPRSRSTSSLLLRLLSSPKPAVINHRQFRKETVLSTLILSALAFVVLTCCFLGSVCKNSILHTAKGESKIVGTLFMAKSSFWALAAVVVVMLLSLSTTRSALAAGTELTKEERLRMCGSVSDCLRIRASSRAEMVVDGLDFEKDTPEDVIRRLPSWFGPAERPLVLGFSAWNVLKMKTPLAKQNIAVGDAVDLIVDRREKQADTAGTADL